MSFRAACLIAPLALMPVYGCQTVDKQAPIELQEAEQALDAAAKADVEDLMPSAFEAAQRKFQRSAELLEEASDYQADKETSQASGTRDEGIKLALESKAISENALKLVGDMQAYNANAGEYIAVAERGERAIQLEADNAALKTQLAQVEGQYDSAVRDNEDLSNRKPEEVIPADFRVAKTMAFFTSGSTTLEAKFRPEIADLATMLKANPNLEVKLEGFADPRGSAALNKSLAEKRLAVVANELKAQGVKASQVKTVTVGETAENATGDAGSLQLDRKVTATVSVVAH